MVELVIFGRGGQGGVTLAKLIAASYFLQGKFVQSFGVYAAERAGAPLNAFVRIDEQEIVNRNQIYEPDHVIVLDRSLISERILAGLKPGGIVLLNSPDPPAAFAAEFPGYRLATVDATAIAVAHKLGTRATPIVNSTLLGAVARVFDFPLHFAQGALADLGFGGANLEAARTAHEAVRQGGDLEAPRRRVPVPPGPAHPTSILSADVGGAPRIQTGSWATHRPARHEWTPPCSDGCPAGNDVRGFVAAVKDDDLDRALAILHRTSPLPSICGRVCPAPCMGACHRQHLDEAVNIPELERWAGDNGRPQLPAVEPRGDWLGVVGSGPGGLSAAYQLARLGYPVTIYEAGAELGGVLRTGIPPYRLPREVLDREIAWVMAYAVEAVARHPVDRAELKRLARRHQAVFVATGLQGMRTLDLGIDDPRLLVQGIAFLDDARQGKVRLDHERVVVIGGGNTAMDAARTAMRLGARAVRVLYRRTRAEMPAIADEIEEAIEEGVILEELVAPLAVERRNGGALLRCQRMALGEPDESGRRAPLPRDDRESRFSLDCERVILALGQLGDVSVLPEGAEVREGDARLGLTEAPVFLGGDLHSSQGTVAAAIASGRRAALQIHQMLSGEDLLAAARPPLIPRHEMKLERFDTRPAHHGARLPVAARLARPGDEVRRGFAAMVASAAGAVSVAEAERCLSCGGCNHCDLCRESCPEGVVVRDREVYGFRYDYCKGCGLCASECPRGIVFMGQV